MNMNPNTFIFIGMIFSFLANAQQSYILGSVSIHNSKFETGKIEYVHLAQVEEELGRATPTTTEEDGNFKLVVVGIAEKERFKLAITKKGYDVVNFDKLNVVAGQKARVKITMAAPQYLADFRKKIYKVGVTNAEKALAEKIKLNQTAILLERKKREINQKRIKKLQAEYDQLINSYEKIHQQATDLANKYVRINLDDVSPLYQEAFRYFQQGDLEKALDILNKADIIGKSMEIIKERKKITTIRKELIERDSIHKKRAAEFEELNKIKNILLENSISTSGVVDSLKNNLPDSTNSKQKH